MTKLVFLLEEPSMKILLDNLLPRFYPDLNFQCVPHEGKSDLEQSIPRKLKAWREPGARFVVLRDNDNGNCRMLKGQLVSLCTQAGRPDTRVRIVCQELEAWYFGEPEAIAKAYDDPKLAQLDSKATYRDADAIVSPSKELVKWVPEFQKRDGALRLSQHLTRDGNRSRSFQVLMESIEHLLTNTEE